MGDYCCSRRSSSSAAAASSSNDFDVDDAFQNYTNSERCFINWLLGDTKYKNERLKLIPQLVQGPWVVRGVLRNTPVLIGKKVPIIYHYEAAEVVPNNSNNSNDNDNIHNNETRAPFLLCELDVGNELSSSAKRIVNVCKRYMNSLTTDIGFLIQGNKEDELPEQMMGSIRIHSVD